MPGTGGPPHVARRLSPTDAVVLGLGSMIGAGVFGVFAPAARAAGSLLLVGLAVAAAVAFCNATASAQLAAQYPVSGGTYVYGRVRLGPWAGFVAGWSFVIGKTASCAAMAMTFAAYAAPEPWRRPVAVAAVVVVAGIGLTGVTRTARLTRVLVVPVIVVLLAVLAAGVSSAGAGASDPAAEAVEAAFRPTPGGWYGVLASAALLFFAFAGYARIATLGEEVRDPARTIPRAILVALAVVLVLYTGLAATALAVLGAGGLAGSAAPLRDVALAAGWPWLVPALGVAVTAGALGALAALLPGVSRTVLAMSREHDLPAALAAVDRRRGVPRRAEVAVAAAVCVLVLVADLRAALGFSSFGVLLYYAVANAAAWTQGAGHRRFPRWLQACGLVGCLALVAALPTTSIAVGLGVVLAGVAGRAAWLVWGRRRLRPPAHDDPSGLADLPDLPAGLTSRPLAMSDAPAVFDLIAAQELHDTGEVAIEEADVVGDWQRPSFDLAAQTLGVLDGGVLVAYAEHRGADRGDAAVHPDHRGRGIGTALAGWMQQRARAAGATEVGMAVPQGSDGDRLLAALGYHVRWESWVLQLPAGADVTTCCARPAPMTTRRAGRCSRTRSSSGRCGHGSLSTTSWRGPRAGRASSRGTCASSPTPARTRARMPRAPWSALPSSTPPAPTRTSTASRPAGTAAAAESRRRCSSTRSGRPVRAAQRPSRWPPTRAPARSLSTRRSACASSRPG